MSDASGLIDKIRDSVIGKHHETNGPFGFRLVTYADYTASGRSLKFIEDFISEHVLPYYANTHTESSSTGLQTTQFREDARTQILESVGGNDDDVVIFSGSGATGAINKLVDILNIRVPANLDDTYHFVDQIAPEERPVVFVGPYEHHSNELPWRESIADVVVIDLDENGHPNLALLREALATYADRPLKIGSFSAASNVTGIVSDTRQISAILHAHGALAFWDFAAAAPYVQIEMQRTAPGVDDHKDAIFISPHKFIGGPGTPGILVVKKTLLTNRVPSVPGGGTVAYVGPDEHRYLEHPAHREEGGTPDIVGAIRAGLVFRLKDTVGAALIHEREQALLGRAIERWNQNPNIQILGNVGAERLSIVSFMTRHGDKYLHHNFVVSLLSDLFGIQARGGCSCAGPYGHRLLGIDIVQSKEYQSEILRGCEGIKPGWTRINFNYFVSEATFSFILEAVDFVAREGWKFLALYRFSPDTGLWRHKDWEHRANMRLRDVEFRADGVAFPHSHVKTDESALAGYIESAHKLAEKLPTTTTDCCEALDVGIHFESLRWFPLPNEGQA
jgi:selenocysteine lyase/cysteine desulfurase